MADQLCSDAQDIRDIGGISVVIRADVDAHHQLSYGVPFAPLPGAPLFTSYTPPDVADAALATVGGGTTTQVSLLSVTGSTGTERR